MIILKNVLKTETLGNIYPDSEFLEDYKGSTFADFISTLIIDAMTGDNMKRLGDTSIILETHTTNKKGDEGIEELKTFAKEFIRIIKESIPEMSQKYQEFYNYFLDDLEKNGFIMPFQGTISLD